MKFLSKTVHEDGNFSMKTVSLFEGQKLALVEFGVARARREWVAIAILLWRVAFSFSISSSPDAPLCPGRLRLRLGRRTISASISLR